MLNIASTSATTTIGQIDNIVFWGLLLALGTMFGTMYLIDHYV